MILIASRVIGVIQIFTGMIISVRHKCKSGEGLSALFEEGAWWFILIGVALMVLGVGQLVRIFVLPLSAFTTIREGVGLPVMELPQFIYVTVCLCLSSLSCFVAGLVGIDRSRKLARYNASLANQPV